MDSVFCSLITKTIPIAGTDGATAVIRKLAPKQLRAAQRASQRQALADVRELGGPRFLQEIQALGGAQAVAQAAAADPLIGYDVDVLLQHGIITWTLDREPNAETFDDLDDDVRDALARAILMLAKPGLFQTIAQEEADQKNA